MPWLPLQKRVNFPEISAPRQKIKFSHAFCDGCLLNNFQDC